ncbi:MAG: pantetheine-phosphate adenylyltransferase [Actinomyces ruminicola]|uniref:Phosphopantetheine adenylyltransferase n=1 Tax=Actinomyces ruminicola TaxID=332524 RepID=A0A1G9WE59_9ACTO|nr:pantetheine-phosphate adenylyltransferase [Actinomyces ruminicola]MBE6481362.1 pantetheine-phosphate adenylyltransferase [Actinomyces ruminicola]SDM82587.1 Phosphopantetheine adenylyltransferase [Actinomyces ruminicola]
MTLAVYPGTFDPITLGHVDVVRRAGSVFDRVILGIARNATKDGSRLFSIEERVALARAALADLPDVEVAVIPGLLADFCARRGADAIVKGLRNGTDFDAEVPMALLNRELGAPETFFLAAAPTHAHVSSSLVKDVARHGGDVSGLVPPGVAVALARALAAPGPGATGGPPSGDLRHASPESPQNRRTNP